MAKPDPTNPDHATRTICLDFDGVLNQFKGWTGQYEDYFPLPRVDKFISTLHSDGWRIVISTARPDIGPVIAWLETYHLMKYISQVTNHKPIALVYVDDRAVYFGGDYHVTLKAIQNMTPWYHKKSKKVLIFYKMFKIVWEYIKYVAQFYFLVDDDSSTEISF